MRLIFDLFPSQTDSRFRGIGRYTLSLAKAMAEQAGPHDMRLLANGLYPHSAAQFRTEFSGLVPPGAYATYTHLPMDPRLTDDLQQEKIASALVHTAYQTIGADAVLCASPFEGWCERGIVAQPEGKLPAGLKVAVLYDFIPWLFPKQHLDPVPNYKHWYSRRLTGLREYDLLLAISEATRADAIRLLDLPPERVVNISGAADAKFRKLSPQELAAIDLRRFGINRPFVLYTGNGDYRKNLTGMLSAYARLPSFVRDAHQLVVNQVGNLELFMTQVTALGLSKDSVVVTGHITDDELLALYNQCKVFVFPSLYEGFGLPVLEAMGCGAAVIAANNSSIPEVAGRNDLLFDASSPDAILAKLLQALTDDAWRADLSQYGVQRAAQFSWENTARTAWRAIESAQLAREVGMPAPTLQGKQRLRIAVVIASAPGPGRDSAMALRAALSAHADVTMVADQEAGNTGVPAPLTLASLPQQWNRFDTILYIATQATLSPPLVDLIRSAPGVLLLQDTDTAAAAALPASLPATDVQANQVLRDGGLQGLVALHRGWENRTGSATPLSRSLIEALRCLIIEGDGMAAALRKAFEPNALPRLVVLGRGEHVDEAANAVRVAAALRTAASNSWRGAAAHIAAAWRGTIPDDNVLDEVAQHAERNLRLNRGRRILIDVTQLARTDALSGIQRVVRNIAREMCLLEGSSTPIELVQLRDRSLYRANAVAGSIFEFDPTACPVEQIDVQPGDILFMIDSSWEQYPDFLPTFDTIRQFGGRIVTVIYDLIPLRMPQYCSAGLVLVFQQWFGLAVKHSDMLLCISRAVRDDANAYIGEHQLERDHALRVEYWHLGADILPLTEDDSVRPAVARMVADTSVPLFLMVGTIEPRKGHALVLDAFEALWAAGNEVRLCWAGKEGWEVDALMARVRNHPELGRRLHFVERFTDAEINLCYAHAHALIAASVAEGYGLPIVEAAQHQVPVLASDIPVFREVAGEGACYFGVDDQAALMQLVLEFSQLGSEERRTMAALVPILTWHESAAWALRLLESTFGQPA
jgi:glycosyltransferase involved in cell wall biosynthesis